MAIRAAHISFFLDPQGREPEQMLRDWPSLVDVADAAAGAGVDIAVIQASKRSATLDHHRIPYHFIEAADGRIGTTEAFARLIQANRFDVVHVHGLGFPLDVIELARLVPNTPILIQDHFDRVPRPWRRRLARRGLAHAAAFAFCAKEQAEPFARARIVSRRQLVFEIPESGSHFTPGDREAARAHTGIAGDPAVLWVGRLNANKDPFTVLEGVRLAAQTLPNLKLWCCFGDAPLVGAVQRVIARDPLLSDRVRLLGRQPHEQIEQLMRAADFFALGSRSEGSGYALIEALACGLPPIVTDIPSFRALTDGGSIGALWPCGAAKEFCERLVSLAARPRPAQRSAARAHFDREISFPAIGRKWAAAYATLLRARRAESSTAPAFAEERP